jgi:hypothetical protein
MSVTDESSEELVFVMLLFMSILLGIENVF